MLSDFKNLRQSGSSCVGCGRGPNDGVMLMRMRTYSLSLCCAACFIKYATCANVNVLGVKCGHDPIDHYSKIGPCSIGRCGCPRWVHGLENEHDRQYADAVGKAPVSQNCHGFAGKTCDNIVFVGKDGKFEPLCISCRREWIKDVQAGFADAKKILELDEETEVPN